ncbi:MAG: hypothetical protein JW969_09220 [Spirochaetales bacterium]|nr:hypothetical protein [Spirochaetales bacterium]
MTRKNIPVFLNGIGILIARKKENLVFAAYLSFTFVAFLFFTQRQVMVSKDLPPDYSFFFINFITTALAVLISVYQALMEMASPGFKRIRTWFGEGIKPLSFFLQKFTLYAVISCVLSLLPLPFLVIQAVSSGMNDSLLLFVFLYNVCLLLSVRLLGFLFSLLHKIKEFPLYFVFFTFLGTILLLYFGSTFLLPQVSIAGALLNLNNPLIKNLSEIQVFQTMKLSASFDYFPGVYWTGLFLNLGLIFLSFPLSLFMIINYHGKIRTEEKTLEQ